MTLWREIINIFSMKAIEIGGALPSKAFETLPNIYLVGPMGAGKTTVGRHLAELLGREFLDSDHEIERKTGATIPWIFEKRERLGSELVKLWF